MNKSKSLLKFSLMSLIFSVGACFQAAHVAAASLDVAQEAAMENFFQNIPSAWKGHREFAEWLVEHMQPEQIVDLGVDLGYSTFVFAKAADKNEKGNVTGIDLFTGDGMTGMRNTYDLILSKLSEFGLTNVDIIKGDFEAVSKTWQRPVDILHIDGYHSYEAVQSDFNNWSPFVKDTGIILFHDINVNNPSFGVIYAFNDLEDGYRLYFLQSYGLGIYTKNKQLAEEIKAAFNNVYEFKGLPL